MGQIVKRKKKGRPSKADLARHSASGLAPSAAVGTDMRRSLRQRNVRYNNFIDYDDYLDEFEDFEGIEEDQEDRQEVEDEEEQEDTRRKEKELRLVVKLHNQTQRKSRVARGGNAHHGTTASSSSTTSSSSSEGEEEEENENERTRPLKNKRRKKRRINDGVDSNCENGDGEDNDDNQEEKEKEKGNEGETKDAVKGQDSVPGTPSDQPNGLPLPENKTLELILDKLQKKDTYGVYAEPVDLEELPDYLDVVDHPMDFATVRKKLGNGSYSTLEQFEGDVFLICSNAMQYNAPETIYHKQARAIQELAKKKFQKLKDWIKRSEKELKSDQKPKLGLSAKKQIKKPLSRSMQEAVGSDLSSGATLANTVDVQIGGIATHIGSSERPRSTDGIVNNNSTIANNNLEKTEEQSSGRGLLSRFGRKQSLPDENRRATYTTSNQPAVRSESVISTFEGEIKQLVAVGLHVENSYARSVACFAATLGPAVWKVAARRIEQAIPPGCKYGRGWVGEYEPLPTPILMLETGARKEPVLFPKSQYAAVVQKNDGDVAPSKKNHVKVSTADGKQSLFSPTSGPISEGKPSSFSSVGSKYTSHVNNGAKQQNFPPRNLVGVSKKVELNLPPSNCQRNINTAGKKQLPNNPDVTDSKPWEMPKTMGLLQSVQSMPSKQPDSVPPRQPESNGAVSVGLRNGKVINTSLNNRMTQPQKSDGGPNQMTKGAIYFPKAQEQGLIDPADAMRMSSEKAQRQQKRSIQSSADTSSELPSVPLATNDSSNAAAVAAARAWMLGAGGFRPPTENSSSPISQISAQSLYNPARQLHPQIASGPAQFPFPSGTQLLPEKNNFPFQAFLQPAVHAGNGGQVQGRPIFIPQLVATDLTRCQMQSRNWRGSVPLSQPKQKQDRLPPDLNIGFQSPGSPVKQSSGITVDSQQPDLALQL